MVAMTELTWVMYVILEQTILPLRHWSKLQKKIMRELSAKENMQQFMMVIDYGYTMKVQFMAMYL